MRQGGPEHLRGRRRVALQRDREPAVDEPTVEAHRVGAVVRKDDVESILLRIQVRVVVEQVSRPNGDVHLIVEQVVPDLHIFSAEGVLVRRIIVSIEQFAVAGPTERQVYRTGFQRGGQLGGRLRKRAFRERPTVIRRQNYAPKLRIQRRRVARAARNLRVRPVERAAQLQLHPVSQEGRVVTSMPSVFVSIALVKKLAVSAPVPSSSARI